MTVKKIRCLIQLAQWIDGGKATDVSLPANETFVLMVSLPLGDGETKFGFKFKTGKNGLGFAGLVNKIAHYYERVYSNKALYGFPKYELKDLILGEIRVDFKTNTITLEVAG